eukprot:sb/3465657/
MERMISRVLRMRIREKSPSPVKQKTPTPSPAKEKSPSPKLKSPSSEPKEKTPTPSPKGKTPTPTPKLKSPTPTPVLDKIPTPSQKQKTPTPSPKQRSPTPKLKSITPGPSPVPRQKTASPKIVAASSTPAAPTPAEKAATPAAPTPQLPPPLLLRKSQQLPRPQLLWKAVERGVRISWDLEGTPLQIKTDSSLGSGDMFYVNMYGAGNVQVKFSSNYRYKIQNCNYETDLPKQPPVSEEVDKIWKFTKTETALIISCNDLEVLNYVFKANYAASWCDGAWSGDKVGEISFHSGDTASDFYLAPAPIECPAFTVDGSTEGNWTASSPGTSVTVVCERKHLLIGVDGEITCQDSGNWSPYVGGIRCQELSKKFTFEFVNFLV